MISLGCGDSLGPTGRQEEPIQTDRVQYEAVHVDGEGAFATYEFTVVAVFHNATDQTVYLDRCFPDSPGPIYGVPLADAETSEDESGYNPAWACVGHDRQFAVEPGGRRTDTLRIHGPNAWSGGQPLGVLDGDFRLIYGVRSCPDECPRMLDEAFRTSNVFAVRIGG